MNAASISGDFPLRERECNSDLADVAEFRRLDVAVKKKENMNSYCRWMRCML